MDCIKLQSLLDGYLDRELDRNLSMTVEGHLKTCGDCSRNVAARSSIGTALKNDGSYHPAPQALVNRIRAQIGQISAPRAARVRPPLFKSPKWSRWLPLGGAFATAVLMTSFATVQVVSVSEDERIVTQLLSGHARSVVTGHQIDVASSDQHTVKPWLSSKLDFSPAVIDLTAAGFPLRGGRLDYVTSRPVAVLVYGHGQHLIDLFIWPEDTAATEHASHTFSQRGLNVVHWRAAGMSYWAVSDIDKTDLREFAKRYTVAEKST